jgi:hypothetical protein
LGLIEDELSKPLSECIREFTEKSMIFEELSKTIEYQHQTIDRLSTELENKKSKIDILRTPVECCRRYLELEKKLPSSINKNRKEVQKEIEQLKDTHVNIVSDSVFIKELDTLEKNIETREKSHLHFLENYIKNQVEKVIRVLHDDGYLTTVPTEEISRYVRTPLGNIASRLAEVHPLIWTKSIVEKWNYFENFSPKEMVGLLSCITDIKVPNEYNISVPTTDNSLLVSKLKEMSEMYQEYENKETSEEMRTGISYENALSFNIIEESMLWCDCDSEEECKWFIQTKLSEKEISIGDFSKAMMKIATCAKEFRMALDIDHLAEHTECLYKLDQIEKMVLKYIATSQSLYV